MPYHIWDTPDYKDLDKKLWAVTKVATVYSTASAAATTFGHFLPPSGRAFLYIYANTFIPTVTAANAGMLTAYTVARARGNVDQHWNYLPACAVFAAVSAGLRQLFNKNYPWGHRFGSTFVLALSIIIAKYGHMNRNGGWPLRMTLNIDRAGDGFGNLRTYRPDVEYLPQDWGRRQ
ncbi:uncharacterized protein LOC128396994 [Panonychus citri]|uniref:uncharacterized protein LOC128396994 n=1 Tax=Panonychus citri TaxID=50023 RepID=UPI0023078006|nr:uncharacterized protein LOC128396994 [Panonychus citri]